MKSDLDCMICQPPDDLDCIITQPPGVTVAIRNTRLNRKYQLKFGYVEDIFYK